MTIHRFLSEETVIEEGIQALMLDRGPVETARFPQLARTQIGDYVQGHREWQDSLDVDQFLEDMFAPAAESIS